MNNRSQHSVALTFIFLFATFMLSGCTGTAYLNTFIKPPDSAYTHKALHLYVDANRYSGLAGFEDTRIEFEQNLLESLKSKSRFKEVTLISEKSIDKGQLLMVVTIDHVHFVSTGSRIAAGVFAGTASFKTRIELYENNIDNRIAEMICGTTSKSSQGIFGASTSHQADLVAQKIADEFSP
jgi:hypothetical protein